MSLIELLIGCLVVAVFLIICSGIASIWFPILSLFNSNVWLVCILISPVLIFFYIVIAVLIGERIDLKKRKEANIFFEDAKVMFKAKKYNVSIDLLSKAIAIIPTTEYYYERAHLKDEINDLVGAEKDFTEAIRLASLSNVSPVLLANCYKSRADVRIDLGNEEEALEDMDKSKQFDEKN